MCLRTVSLAVGVDGAVLPPAFLLAFAGVLPLLDECILARPPYRLEQPWAGLPQPVRWVGGTLPAGIVPQPGPDLQLRSLRTAISDMAGDSLGGVACACAEAEGVAATPEQEEDRAIFSWSDWQAWRFQLTGGWWWLGRARRPSWPRRIPRPAAAPSGYGARSGASSSAAATIHPS